MNNIFSTQNEHRVLKTNFHSKVIAIFALALLTSAAGIFVTISYFAEVIFTPFAFYGLLALELILVFQHAWSKKEPINKVLFILFAFISGVTAAPLIYVVLAEVGPAVLFKALIATAATFGGFALLGSRTEKNLSFLGGLLPMILIGMIVMSVFQIFWPWSNSFELIFSGAGIVLFALYTMYDFQKLKYFRDDQYIDAALMLYLDIFNLFIFILRFFLASSRN